MRRWLSHSLSPDSTLQMYGIKTLGSYNDLKAPSDVISSLY
jgi:hypothetical protein